MGYYPYNQKCVKGHEWTSAFCSVDMSDTWKKNCPECGELATDSTRYATDDSKPLDVMGDTPLTK